MILTDEQVFNSERYLREYDKRLAPSQFDRSFPELARYANPMLIRGDRRMWRHEYDRLAARRALPGWARVRNGFSLYEHRRIEAACCHETIGVHRHTPCESHVMFVVGQQTLAPRAMAALLKEHPSWC